MILLILGAVIGVLTLAVVGQVSLFGATCFFVGEFSPQTQCLHPAVYYAPLGLAAVLFILGAVQLFRPKSNTSSN
jgi:hypothetical protein